MTCPPCLGNGRSIIHPGTICEVCKGRGILPDTRLNNPSCPPCLGGGLSIIEARHRLCGVCGGWGKLPSEPEGPQVILVSAGKVWDTHMEIASLFKELHGELCICDPYYGTRSLHRLSELIHCQPIRFLTKSADSKERSFIGTALQEFTCQYPYVQFRRSASNDLHDRYLLTATELVILGHGLKDIGGKDSFVIRLGTDTCKELVKTLSQSFNKEWDRATQLS